VHSLLFFSSCMVGVQSGCGWKQTLLIRYNKSMVDTLAPNESLLAKTRFLLDHFDLKARKGLGQHFLVNSGILKNIVAAADLAFSDLVIEVGPGIGVLTHALVERAGWVIAVELDGRLAGALGETLLPHKNFTIINQDILEIEPGDLIEQANNLPSSIKEPFKYKIVANLPYYITQAIIRHFCEARLKPHIMVIMLQKEVAKNIVAQPGEMSILAVSVQYFGIPRIVGYVPAANFYPVPKVDSAILKIELFDQPHWGVTDEGNFFKIVRAGFCAARKQILNSLSQGLKLPRSDTLSWLEKAGIESRRRAETLEVAEWARLEKTYAGVLNK
jgi:16S rRNA (adenine1518-N6/adenine1519-N6)-dimethyltransferase